MPKERINNTNKQYEQILRLIQSNATFTQMAKELGIAKSTLSVILKTMEKRGLVERQHKGRILILTIPHAIQNNLGELPKLPSYRIHNLWLTFKLKDSIENDTTRLVASRGLKLTPRPLANHTDSFFIIDSYEACLSPSSIQIHLPDLDRLSLDTDLRQAATNLMVKAEDVILKLEDRLGLKVIRIDRDTLIAKISQLHIALRDHKFAQTINEKGEKLYVFEDGELRVVIDASHGLDEYEAVNAKFALPDAQRLGKLTKAVITGNFDYEKDQSLLHGTIASLNEATKLLSHYAKNMESHARLVNQASRLIKELRHERKARAMLERDIRQRKLS